MLANDGFKYIIEPVCFNLKHGGEILSKLTAGPALARKPLQVVNGKLRDIPILVLPERHTGLHKFYKKISLVHWCFGLACITK